MLTKKVCVGRYFKRKVVGQLQTHLSKNVQFISWKKYFEFIVSNFKNLKNLRKNKFMILGQNYRTKLEHQNKSLRICILSIKHYIIDIKSNK